MSNLFSQFKIKDLTLKNRIAMAPMTRSRATNPEQKATELIALYYAERASAGLIIAEGTPINKEAIGYIYIPGIYTKPQIEGWRLVTDKVHKNDGAIFAQLWHVGRVSHPDLLDNQLPLAPSAINPHCQAFTKDGFVDTVTPKAMTVDDIKKTINDYQKAAINAFEAGFDGIEIHAANAYLLNQFFAKCSNTRTDEYGGSIENRARILFEIIDSVAEKIDLSKVGVRLSPDLDGLFGITKDDESDALFEYIINKLNNYNLAYLHISGFGTSNSVQEVAKKYRSIYKGNYMINGSFTKELAEEAIDSGLADLVSFGRPFIANPDLVERFKENAPLNEPDRDTFYGGTEIGFTDYPTLKEQHLK